MKIDANRLARFKAKCLPPGENGCVLWRGGKNEHGYGVFWNGEKLEKAHRFALRAAGVSVPADSDVCHHCDTPGCVNPAHLFVGDAKKNVADMWAKGRAMVVTSRGESQSQAKLTQEKAAKIRALWRAGGWKQRDLGALFGVSQRTIWNVVSGRNWVKGNARTVTPSDRRREVSK